MGEAAKKICLASLEDQSCLENSIVLQPYSFMAPSKLSISVDSSFKPWKNPSSKSLDASERHNHPQLEPQHAISNNSSMLATNNHEKIMENPNLDQAEKNLINGSFVTHGVGANVNTSHICEGKANEPNLHLNLATKMGMGDDPKRLKRMIANRGYAKKHSLKKKHYIANLEKQTSSLTSNIFSIRFAIEENKNRQHSLLIEHHQLKLRMATLEKDRIIKEVDIEKKMEEVKRLKELQINQLQGSTAGSSLPKIEET